MKKKLLIAFIAIISVFCLAFALTGSSCNNTPDSGNNNEQGGDEEPYEHREHNYKDEVVSPDCLNGGYTLHTCACGDSYRDSETNALGHSFIHYVSDENASCTHDGTKTAKCERCTVKDTVTDEENPAFGHTEVIDNPVSATCTTTGLSEGKHCSVCKTVLIQQVEMPINPAAHIYSEQWANDNASHWYTATCGHENVKEFAEHNWKGKTCTVCDYTADYTVGLNIGFAGNEAFVYGLIDDTETEIIIPSTYGGKPVTKIVMAAFKDFGKITSVTIPDSVKTIENYAFNNSGITEIIIPDSVTAIGEQAFAHCFKLTKATLGNGLKEISRAMFETCLNLKEIKIGNGVKTICERAFSLCLNLTELQIPDSVETIGNYAFDSCANLYSVSIGNGVTSVGENAFSSCGNLMSLIIGSNVNRIESGAFYWCTKLIEIFNLSSLNIRKGNEESHGGVGLYALNIYKTDTAESKLKKTDGGFVFYENYGDKEVNCLVGYVGSEKNLTLPENYKGGDYEIFTNAFTGNGDYSIDDTVISFGIKSVTIPACVTAIGERAFFNCLDLVEVTFEENAKLSAINSYTFAECRNLKSIIIPENVTSIGGSAFSFCTRLKNINYNAISCYVSDAANVLSEAGSESEELILNIGNKVKEIPAFLFDSTNISKVTFEKDSVCESISDYAFSGCIELESVELPDNITTIGNGAFYGCTNLTRIEIACNVTTINESTFSGCSSLANLTIPDSVTSIGNGAFGGCSSLTKIEIPNGVTSIGDSAFWDCSGLTSVKIPDGITEIGDSTFYNCSGLASIIIPDSVTKININAFGACYGLEKVYYSGTAEDWAEIILDNNNNYDNDTCLINATRYYYSETKPSEAGNYWHYVDGEVVEWVQV